MANIAYGLSHIIIPSPTEESFNKTIRFYNQLGYEKVIGNEESENLNDIRQAWLQLSCHNEEKASSMIIKVVLNENTNLSYAEKKKDLTDSMEDTFAVLKVNNLDQVKHILKENNYTYQETEASIITQDPNNNVLVLTTATNAFFEHKQNIQDKEKNNSTTTTTTQQKKKLAVLTSGGDASGMNACVRAVVRYGISKGCDVYAVYEGYQGLVDGGEYIKKMDWRSVTRYLTIGGTLIGTARCMPFKTREGRLQAAYNLVKNGIDSIIVCGGDGSLTGADVFRSEYGGLIEELRKTNRITEEESIRFKHLTIVGLVGSIDNDMSSTDITIGAVTSLHRICEAIDSVNTTALSHSRAFVIEVMGRHCGWLALMAGIATGADFIFIPECPPKEDDWETAMCTITKRHRDLGKRKTIIIVAEGALDRQLNPIKVDRIKDVLTERLGLDTRVTILGHTQRGGTPCAYDRILATVQSVDAVNAVLASTPETPSPMIGMNNNQITTKPLMDAVKLTHQVATAIGNRDFDRAMALRDPQFIDEFSTFNRTTILDDQSLLLPEHERLNIAILNIGAPAAGMDAAARAIVRYGINRGHTIYGVANGFSGLVRGCFEHLGWMDVDGWTASGGSHLGTNRAVPGKDVDMGKVAFYLQKYKIQSLMLVGGFEAFTSLVQLSKARTEYPSLCIPISLIPATISNNVPGTDFSLGCDTSLNAIVDSCDAIVQSAQSSRRRVFVVEVQGGRSGYLAVEGGLAVGACAIYIPEEGINLPRLQSDVEFLKHLYDTDDPEKSEGRVILRTEAVSNTYTTEVISNILEDEGGARFDSRTAVLGHIQQGGTPSPLDRIRATRLAVHSVEFAEQHTRETLIDAHLNQQSSSPPIALSTSSDSLAVIGLSGTDVHAQSVLELLPTTDLKNRKPLHAWWQRDRSLVDTLSGRNDYSNI